MLQVATLETFFKTQGQDIYDTLHNGYLGKSTYGPDTSSTCPLHNVMYYKGLRAQNKMDLLLLLAVIGHLIVLMLFVETWGK